MTSKLTIFNGSLRLLGERRTTLTEDRPARYYLDDAWDDGLVDDALEQGFWNFAMRTVQMPASTSVEPEFGYRYAFQKPTDYIRTAALCTDEFFKHTLHEYTDEANYWFADNDTLYLQYISNHVDYGLNIANWSGTFTAMVEAMLADEVKELVTGNDGKYDRIKKALKDARIDARSKDAMNQPVKFAPAGSWVSARMTSRVNNNGTT
jgi:hypothetical protein